MSQVGQQYLFSQHSCFCIKFQNLKNLQRLERYENRQLSPQDSEHCYLDPLGVLRGVVLGRFIGFLVCCLTSTVDLGRGNERGLPRQETVSGFSGAVGCSVHSHFQLLTNFFQGKFGWHR